MPHSGLLSTGDLGHRLQHEAELTTIHLSLSQLQIRTNLVANACSHGFWSCNLLIQITVPEANSPLRRGVALFANLSISSGPSSLQLWSSRERQSLRSNSLRYGALHCGLQAVDKEVISFNQLPYWFRVQVSSSNAASKRSV